MNNMNTSDSAKSSDIEKGISSKKNKFVETPSDTTNLLEEDEISEVQPAIHEERKGCCEKFCKFFYRVNNDLTLREYKKFNQLKRDCLVMFDEKNPEHEKILKEVFENYLDIMKLEENFKNSEKEKSWKTLGFQSENPRTDFRAAGFLSLKFMHYFIWMNPTEFKEMLQLEYFLFAIVCIRLTFTYRLFFTLIKDSELDSSLKSHKVTPCSRKQFKAFCFQLVKNENILFILLSLGLKFLKKKFVCQTASNKNELNFLLIDPLIKRALRCLESVLDSSTRDKEEDFEGLCIRKYEEEELISP